MADAVCPLLWGSFQIDLESGRVKACCKTAFERLDDGQDFADFLNLPNARQARAVMLAGRLPAACDSCRREEAAGLESYRNWFGMEGPLRDWAKPLAEANRVDNGFPGHIELIFSTTCNLRCSYCGPEFSSAWRAAGGETSADRDVAASNFAESFWRWYEVEAERCLSVQINGGEPLIDPGFGDKLLRLAQPLAGLPGRRIGIVSNLSMGPAGLERRLPVLHRVSRMVHLVIGISVDGVGEVAECRFRRRRPSVTG